MVSIEHEPGTEDPNVAKTKGTDLEKLLKFSLLIVPVAALASANYYFVLLTWKLNFFPVSVFTVQDHFDKAIDFLLVVFGYMLIMNVVIGYVMGAFGYSFAEHSPSRRSVFRILSPFALLFVGLVGFVTSPPEELGVNIFIMLAGVFGLFARNIMKIIVTVFFVKEKWYNLALGSLIAIIFVTGHIFMRVESDVRQTKESYFQNKRAVIQDKFSIGYLVADDQRFRIVGDQGATLFEGDKFSAESKSPGCQWGWSWACRRTITFDAGK
jgi:hypothetical protein